MRDVAIREGTTAFPRSADRWFPHPRSRAYSERWTADEQCGCVYTFDIPWMVNCDGSLEKAACHVDPGNVISFASPSRLSNDLR